MSRSPMHFHNLEQTESSTLSSSFSTKMPITRSHLLSNSPCPAISSWPAPPPKIELKPTAIATPLSISSNLSPSISPFRSIPTNNVQLSQLTLHNSPIPPFIGTLSPHSITPIPRLELPQQNEEQNNNNSNNLLTMLREIANSSGTACSSSNINCWGRETELRQKIQALEEIVAEYEKQKFNVLGTFTDFRERVAERERRLEAEYSTRILSLSEEVLGAKKDFEERMKSFQLLQEQFEREKEQALEKLRQDHQREMQALEQRFSESKILNLEQKYILEIQKLEEERKNLKIEREKLNEGFEVRFRRAESLFESELTAAKMLYTKRITSIKKNMKKH
ncbi:FAM184 domain-containing protein [Meloidogyne graminicola]|uniref:FAM184 domain-containing protein n=1 Tax=Meloidogyne graminicola TaxID=189291 RepID=A0A8T0A3V0_9BILA|nr:FAM184 domain-containing protein [Meloidogyne graminicola]